MKKEKVESINLRIDSVIPCWEGIIIRWSSDIGFGEYCITTDHNDQEKPEETTWIADTECMDTNEHKALGEKLLQLWMEQIRIDD
ncbi:MAG: hypothetical protein IKG03_01870 [Clostridiales bacterium]|nr:hypothetical protein [Clostridiales bacterium]